MPIDVTYPALLVLFGEHAMKQPTESRQFLAWFLENYWRLDETEVPDSIVDISGDNGIDGVYANDEMGYIDVFQATIKKNATKTIGHKTLKMFFGSYERLTTPEGIQYILDTAPNTELAKRLIEIEAKEKITGKDDREKYEVRGIFITNGRADSNAKTYLSGQSAIRLYDKNGLESLYVPVDEIVPIAKPIVFNVGGFDTINYELGGGKHMVIAPILASEIIQMNGIKSGELFAPNVRQWLGKTTKVNKDLAESIDKTEEHQLFPAFHNGLTILCESLKLSKLKVRIAGYGVVNGCQSVRGLYEKQDDLTLNLRILTKFIAVSPTTELAAKITDHTNNQNGISARDLKSNNRIQNRLKREIREAYGDELFFRTKKGERPPDPDWSKDKILENELAGRILLAFDLRRPESCHQAFKVFDELYKDIFSRPEVTSDRIVILYDVYKRVLAALPLISDPLFADYSLTRYFILYLLREVLDADDLGKSFFADPSWFLQEVNGRQRLNDVFQTIITELVTYLDTEVASRNDPDNKETEPFDYKRELKSKGQVTKLKVTILGQYRVSVRNKLTKAFSELWAVSKNVP